MDKRQIDQLYHLLRQVSNEAAEFASSGQIPSDLDPLKPWPGETDAIKGLVNHLITPDYKGLLLFSSMYGTRFILPKVVRLLVENNIHPAKFVDVGCGSGWLGTNLGVKFNVSYRLVDKRQWDFSIECRNLEDKDELKLFASSLEEGDLVTMCDFLHCTDDPKAIIDSIHTNIVVVEYVPSLSSFYTSYHNQLKRYGATSFTHNDMTSMLYPRVQDIIDIDPYEIYLLTGASK